jgi:hypothetical protein
MHGNQEEMSMSAHNGEWASEADKAETVQLQLTFLFITLPL